MDPLILIDQLSRTLMAAYAALPAQDQDGPLGDQISAVLQEADHALRAHATPATPRSSHVHP